MTSYIISSEVEVEGNGVTPGIVKLSDGTDNVSIQAPTTLSGNVEFILPNSVGISEQSLVTDGNNPAILSWTRPPANVANTIVTATNTVSTTSNTYVQIPGMSLVIPADGTYKIVFSSSGDISTNSTTALYAIFLNGTPVSYSIRGMRTRGGASRNNTCAMVTLIQESLTSGDDIDVRYQTSNGNVEVFQRSLSTLRLS